MLTHSLVTWWWTENCTNNLASIGWWKSCEREILEQKETTNFGDKDNYCSPSCRADRSSDQQKVIISQGTQGNTRAEVPHRFRR